MGRDAPKRANLRSGHLLRVDELGVIVVHPDLMELQAVFEDGDLAPVLARLLALPRRAPQLPLFIVLEVVRMFDPSARARVILEKPHPVVLRREAGSERLARESDRVVADHAIGREPLEVEHRTARNWRFGPVRVADPVAPIDVAEHFDPDAIRMLRYQIGRLAAAIGDDDGKSVAAQRAVARHHFAPFEAALKLIRPLHQLVKPMVAQRRLSPVGRLAVQNKRKRCDAFGDYADACKNGGQLQRDVAAQVRQAPAVRDRFEVEVAPWRSVVSVAGAVALGADRDEHQPGRLLPKNAFSRFSPMAITPIATKATPGLNSIHIPAPMRTSPAKFVAS